MIVEGYIECKFGCIRLILLKMLHEYAKFVCNCNEDICVMYCLQMFIFALWACFCVAVCNKLALGLDQTLSMPSDSFVIDYLNSVNHYLSTGKPLL